MKLRFASRAKEAIPIWLSNWDSDAAALSASMGWDFSRSPTGVVWSKRGQEL